MGAVFFFLKWEFDWNLFMNWVIKGRYGVNIRETEEGEIWFHQAGLGLSSEFRVMNN